MDISFVVRTKNEEQWIGHCLQSIVDNFKDPQIIIVDNESEDDSVKIAKMFTDQVCYIKKNEYSPGKALNLGFNLATTSVVGVISAHCEVDKIDKVAFDLFTQDKKLAGVFGHQVPLYKGVKVTPKGKWELFNEDKSGEFFHNGFSFIKRPQWKKNPFNETVTGTEDAVWSQEITARGYRTAYMPELTCKHHWTEGCATWKGLA